VFIFNKRQQQLKRTLSLGVATLHGIELYYLLEHRNGARPAEPAAVLARMSASWADRIDHSR